MVLSPQTWCSGCLATLTGGQPGQSPVAADIHLLPKLQEPGKQAPPPRTRHLSMTLAPSRPLKVGTVTRVSHRTLCSPPEAHSVA